MFPEDLASGMRIAAMRAAATGRRSRVGLGDLTFPTDMVGDANASIAQAAAGVPPKPVATGGNNTVVDPKLDFIKPGMLEPGVTPSASWEAAATGLAPNVPGGTVQTQLAPTAPSLIDRFNDLSTPAKVGVVGGSVAAVATLFWLLKG